MFVPVLHPSKLCAAFQAQLNVGFIYAILFIAYESYHQSFTQAVRDYIDELLLSVCVWGGIMRPEQNIDTQPKFFAVLLTRETQFCIAISHEMSFTI